MKTVTDFTTAHTSTLNKLVKKYGMDSKQVQDKVAQVKSYGFQVIKGSTGYVVTYS